METQWRMGDQPSKLVSSAVEEGCAPGKPVHTSMNVEVQTNALLMSVYQRHSTGVTLSPYLVLLSLTIRYLNNSTILG